MTSELVLLKLTATVDGEDYVTTATTPVSSVEMRTTNEEVAKQAYTQLGKRLLETIESELEELKGDLESGT